ncbi:MAG: PD-(D/E)XK nuclease family protein, partial [Alistipes sp.]
KEHVGALILGGITATQDTCDLCGCAGRYTETEAGVICEFGTPAAPASQKKEGPQAQHEVLEDYLTSEANLRLRLPSQRYFDADTEAELAPRNLGILMHRAFESADTEADIHRAIDEMRADGYISETEAAVLRAAIAKVLAETVAQEWFGGNWDRVRNEHEIIVPGDSHTRRPDRVMLHNERAVVVDYKFGGHQIERYKQQIRDYTELLREIGYTQTEGYLWYVKLGTIEKIV